MAKKFSDVFGSIKYSKIDPKHNKGHVGGSTDDEEHGAVSSTEFDQQVKHAKKRSMTESEAVKRTQTNLKNIERSQTGFSGDDAAYARHIERMKKSRDEYIKNNPNSIYAVKKEEVEQIDEISKTTLGSYVNKAFQHGNDLHYDLAHSKGDKATDAERAQIKAKIDKRNTGVIKAAQKMREEALDEAHKINDKVEIVKGSSKGITGHIGEIRHGLYKGAPKTYTVYHGDHGATQVGKEHIKAIKEDTEPTSEQIDEAIDHIITARQIIGSSRNNKGGSHEYMKFLKHLRDKFGKEYSTNVHQSASKLAKESVELDEGWGAEPARREAEAHAKAYDAVKEKHKRDPEASAILNHLKGMKADYAEKEATGKGKQSKEYWLKDIEKKKARMNAFKSVGVSLNKESVEINESRQADIVREAFTKAKNKKKDEKNDKDVSGKVEKYEADPELTDTLQKQ